MKTPSKISRLTFYVFILAVVLIVYANRDYYGDRLPFVVESIKRTLHIEQACSKPLTYSIGTLDGRFGLTTARLLSIVDTAVNQWESAVDKDLFEHAEDGKIAINLIYDYRQQATVELGKIGIEIKNDRATYDMLKEKHDSLYASYIKQKAELQAAIDVYDIRREAYDERVEYWNRRGGAPKEEYRELETERIALNAEAAKLNQRQNVVNDLVNTLNSIVSVINRLASELNLNVKTYNTIGRSTGEEFDEGEYIRDSSGTRINIYQFEDTDQLIRVIEHELGHALDMDHIDNPKAIMYRLNQSTNQKPTADDIVELKRVCGIE